MAEDAFFDYWKNVTALPGREYPDCAGWFRAIAAPFPTMGASPILTAWPNSGSMMSKA